MLEVLEMPLPFSNFYNFWRCFSLVASDSVSADD